MQTLDSKFRKKWLQTPKYKNYESLKNKVDEILGQPIAKTRQSIQLDKPKYHSVGRNIQLLEFI